GCQQCSLRVSPANPGGPLGSHEPVACAVREVCPGVAGPEPVDPSRSERPLNLDEGDHSMQFKFLTLGVSGLLSLTLLGAVRAASQQSEEPSSCKKKGAGSIKRSEDEPRKGGEAGPEADLYRAYSLLRRLRVDAQTTRSADPRIGEWTERATRYYRDGI